MPGGTLTVMFLSFRIKPVPRHLGHGESIILPFPLQVGQGTTWTNVPKLLLLTLCILPEPLQLGQTLGEVPGAAPEPPHKSHFSILLNPISFSAPCAASSNVISKS